MSTAYTAHVTKRDGTVVRVDSIVENGERRPLVADSRVRAALMAMLQVGEKSRSASARPVDAPVATSDCCSRRSPVSVNFDSAFGALV